jgi:hypothetical protein
MISFFCCPKPFVGHNKVIQTNAISSWTLLRPQSEIIVLGDDEGTSEMAHELGLRHIPAVERNEYGTPMLRSVFHTAEAAASHPFMCYINADIILMSDFMIGAQRVIRDVGGQRFLLFGRRWDIELADLLDFQSADWEQELLSRVRAQGRLGGPDYFLYPKGLWAEIPPFALGRAAWDFWLIYAARATQVPVIEATPAVTVVHQAHDYAHIAGATQESLKTEEVRRNIRLMAGAGKYATWDSTHVLTKVGLRRTSLAHRLGRQLYRPRARLRSFVFRPFSDEDLPPYFFPVALLDTAVSAGLRLLRALLRLAGLGRPGRDSSYTPPGAR